MKKVVRYANLSNCCQNLRNTNQSHPKASGVLSKVKWCQAVPTSPLLTVTKCRLVCINGHTRSKKFLEAAKSLYKIPFSFVPR